MLFMSNAHLVMPLVTCWAHLSQEKHSQRYTQDFSWHQSGDTVMAGPTQAAVMEGSEG
jgi:hypothetical protein